MEIFAFQSISQYNRSMLGFYGGDKHFKNNKSDLLRIVCKPGGVFYQNTVQKMIGVKENGRPLCQCVLIKHKAYDALTVAFFEAAEGAHRAVSRMMEVAGAFAGELGCKRIEVSLDGHCNYSVGFLCGGADRPPLFGESYTPEYYHDFFREYRRVSFTAFCGGLAEIERGIGLVLPKIEARAPDVRLECADWKHFKSAVKRYTDLSNKIFYAHRYCFHRAYEEDYELLSSMKPLLKPCNLIFATKDAKDIGFILLYPDFNELVPPGKKAGIGTLIRHKLFRQKIRTMKIAEMGVLREHRANGAILLLFAEALRRAKQYYKGVGTVVSSWILDENIKSKNITIRFAEEVYKRYAAYEKEI